MPRLVLLLFPALLLFSACGSKEELKPLYQAEKVTLNDAHINYWADIPKQVMPTSPPRKITDKLIGWIPIVGDLVEFPMDLVNVFFPKLKFCDGCKDTDKPNELPSGEWNDPAFLAAVKSIRIGEGELRITPKALRENYTEEMCYFSFHCVFSGFQDCTCIDLSFDNFLKELRIYLMFKDLKTPGDESESEKQQMTIDELGITNGRDPKRMPEILLAGADIETSYNPSKRVLKFSVTDRDLRPYMDLFDRFEIKLVGSGKYPRRPVYIDGRVRIDLVLGLSR